MTLFISSQIQHIPHLSFLTASSSKVTVNVGQRTLDHLMLFIGVLVDKNRKSVAVYSLRSAVFKRLLCRLEVEQHCFFSFNLNIGIKANYMMDLDFCFQMETGLIVSLNFSLEPSSELEIKTITVPATQKMVCSSS